MDPMLISLPIVAGLLVLLWRFLQAPTTTTTTTKRSGPSEADAKGSEDIKAGLPPTTEDPCTSITPLPSFDWRTTPPFQLRPFKPKYHLTMGLENCPLSELLAVDDTYLDRIRLRRELMDAHPTETYQCRAACQDAVAELYEWMFGVYLPQRFPTMFALEDNGSAVRNLVTDETIPLKPADGAQALRTLSAHVDTDMLLLLPSQPRQQDAQPTYSLQAYATCFPSGFATASKLGLPLAAIHAPVPGYAAKLEKSMDRFFARLECGRAVRRANWTVTTDARLFSLGGNHMYAGGEKTMEAGKAGEDVIEAQRAEVQIERCRLRCERQTLHRLPRTGALVFMFKTYQYALADVKAEEDGGAALAEAVEGMATGSVPDMAFYKRQVVWGDAVVEYLRS